MKTTCERMERVLLLQAAGEATGRQARALQAHLAACPSCRATREAWARVEQAAPAAPEGPSAAVRQAIRAAAAERVAHRTAPRIWVPLSLLRPAPALGLASALVLAVTGAWWWRPAPPATGGAEALATMLALVSADGTSLVDEAEGEERLEAFARELLALQGLNGSTTVEEATPSDAAHPATDPLSRSSGGFPAEACG